ncbi:MAG TPA: hypothetical protein VFH99_03050 [Candidatus Saccharimonadales bacterium]|nr:hypothetical protein [Candidatus Saccharimonadales bacterium]
MALSITGGGGGPTSQANTQSPQMSAGSGAPPAAAAKSVQPGTADSLLAGPGGGSDGIPLNSTILPVANLDASTQTVAQTTKPDPKPQHHPNGVLLVVVAILVVLAVVAVWVTNKSAKNTTHY